MVKQIYLDLETTGLDHTRCAIVQLSAIIEIDNEVKKRFSIRMNPALGQQVDVNKNYNLHKTNVYSQQGGFKLFLSILEQYVNPYSPIDKFTLIAYNSIFDEEFLRSWFKLMNNNFYGAYFHSTSECARKMSHYYFKKKGLLHKVINAKLSTVAGLLGIDVIEDNLHDANYDTKLLYKVYKTIESAMYIEGSADDTTLQQLLSGVREGSRDSKKRVRKVLTK